MKFRKKPVVIEAVRLLEAHYNGPTFYGFPFLEYPPWLRDATDEGRVRPATPGLTVYAEWEIITLEGVMLASPGDWIICGIKGELYPCKPDIFAATYEPVEGEQK
jgi:hypothetical protein